MRQTQIQHDKSVGLKGEAVGLGQNDNPHSYNASCNNNAIGMLPVSNLHQALGEPLVVPLSEVVVEVVSMAVKAGGYEDEVLRWVGMRVSE